MDEKNVKKELLTVDNLKKITGGEYKNPFHNGESGNFSKCVLSLFKNCK